MIIYNENSLKVRLNSLRALKAYTLVNMYSVNIVILY